MAPPEEPWKQLYNYWLGKHADGRPPRRADLDPVLDIPRLLPNLILVEFTADGMVYRLVGSSLERGLGMGMSGRKVGASGRYQNVAQSWADAIEYVRSTGKPRTLVPRFPDGVQGSGIAIFLPLSGPDGKTAMVIGGYFNQGLYPLGNGIDGLAVKEIIP